MKSDTIFYGFLAILAAIWIAICSVAITYDTTLRRVRRDAIAHGAAHWEIGDDGEITLVWGAKKAEGE